MPISLLPPLLLSILLVGYSPGPRIWLLAGSCLRGFFDRHRRPCDFAMALLMAVCAVWIVL